MNKRQFILNLFAVFFEWVQQNWDKYDNVGRDEFNTFVEKYDPNTVTHEFVLNNKDIFDKIISDAMNEDVSSYICPQSSICKIMTPVSDMINMLYYYENHDGTRIQTSYRMCMISILSTMHENDKNTKLIDFMYHQFAAIK